MGPPRKPKTKGSFGLLVWELRPAKWGERFLFPKGRKIGAGPPQKGAYFKKNLLILGFGWGKFDFLEKATLLKNPEVKAFFDGFRGRKSFFFFKAGLKRN